MFRVMSASRPSTPQLLLFHLYTSCCFLLAYHVAADARPPFSFSFDFSEISSSPSDGLQFKGDASLQSGFVDLARCMNENCTGGMSYNQPVPFYDTTGAVASFSTRFNFACRVAERNAGDGMAFFLSSYPSRLPLSSGGGTNRFVAIELDVFNDAWCINTGRTTVNRTRLSNLTLENGSVSATASITFSSSTRILVASLHFDDNPSLGSYEASAQLTPVTAFLPSVVGVGFSATAANVDLYQIMSWSFNSTLARKGDTDDTGDAIFVFLIVGVPIPLIVILVASIWFCAASYKHKRQGDSFVKGARDLAKRYEFRELDAATDKFSRSIGQGAFGVVFEGKLEDEDGQQLEVAVKKLKWSNGETENFHAEVKTISETRHKNLVRLNGWCSRDTSSLIDIMCWCGKKHRIELFLVYELVPNGNLDVHLNQKQHVVPWETRYNIVKDIGSALRYLHHECSKVILHRDIKPSNILLDEQYNAKLADFGLSRIAHHKNEAVLTTARETLEADFRSTAAVQTKAMGTRAYMDPNCIKDGIVNFTRYSDVYSFGIVLLEIACTGKSKADVWEQYKRNPENMAAMADARLNGNFDVAQMQKVVVLGLWCSFLDDAQRPSLLQAMEVLEHDAALPNLIELEK